MSVASALCTNQRTTDQDSIKEECTQTEVAIKQHYARKKAAVCLIAAGLAAAKTGYDVYSFCTEGNIPSLGDVTSFAIDGVWLSGLVLGSGYHLMRSCLVKPKTK